MCTVMNMQYQTQHPEYMKQMQLDSTSLPSNTMLQFGACPSKYMENSY